MTITAAERAELAIRHGISDAYLYQCMTGRRQMDAAEARSLHDRSSGRLAVWLLRPKDWHRIWPDLVSQPGAPAAPAANTPDQAAAA